MPDTSHPQKRYKARDKSYDEFIDESGNPRSAWYAFADLIENWNNKDFARREEQMKRIILENGITYNVYSENSAQSRPWTMDMLPIIFDSAEWDHIGGALAQRAELMNLIFKDLYGPQNLLKNGLLPPWLVLANPHFCRPCSQLVSDHVTPIHAYASDLARSPDGNWWILSDRLEAASGLGYSLENRFISSRILPGVMRQLGVKGLDKFVSKLCQFHESLSTSNVSDPQIVLLAAGPANETYFEQSFMARTLGYVLVEGDDLIVRDGVVYLKTISGIKKVDVIIRQLDTAWCDPLELKNESMLGVPGLLDAVRLGNVVVSNALGASLLETPALPAFLPRLCKHLLGEELKIPSVATWWCGQEKEMDYVLENLGKLVLKPSFRSGSGQAVFGPNLSSHSLEKWKERIRKYPHAYCAQELVTQATTPIYRNGNLHPRHFLLRTYSIPNESDWTMMPGGLCRISSESDSINVSMQKGGESKDVWIIDSKKSSRPEPDKIESMVVSPIRRAGLDLPSRVADNFFWLGRYIERTEGMVRVLQGIIENLLDQDFDSDQATLALFSYFTNKKDMEKLIPEKGDLVDQVMIQEKLALQVRDRRNPESLHSNLESLTQASHRVKERLSSQTWQQLLRLSQFIRVIATKRDVLGEESSLVLNETLSLLAGFSGLAMENMTRGQNWVFLDLGRRIERSFCILNLLSSFMDKTDDDEEDKLRTFLKCADSTMTYRRRYLMHLDRAAVFDLLILEKSNPRSLAFQSDRILSNIKMLPHNLLPSESSDIDRHCLRISSTIDLAEPKYLLEEGEGGTRPNLENFHDHLVKEMSELATAIQQQYFAHTVQPSDKLS